MFNKRIVAVLICAGWLLIGSVLPVAADDGPTQDAALIMADWLFLSYLAFLITAVIAFLVALKLGLFRNLEESKYHILDIHEPDYYTPEWAREGAHGTDR